MRSGSRIQALFASLIFCVLLALAAFYALALYPVPPQYHTDAFRVSILAIVALLTVIFHQSFIISTSARSLAKDMTRDMLIYSREFFSELYRGSPVPYVVIDLNGTIESINLAAARFFGVSQNALDAQNMYTFFIEDAEQKTKPISLISEYFKRGKYVHDTELRVRRPDGLERWVLFSLFPATDAEGKRKGMLTLVDITKQKQVDKAKTEFVSLASHQLRTPLSGIKWNIELLESSPSLADAERAYVEKIKRSAARMDSLITDFLSVSKLDLGTLVPEFKQVELIPFLVGVVDEYTALATQKSVRIDTVIPTTIGTIETDSHLLQMVTSNLLGNAVKYTNTGGVVTLTATSDRQSVVLAIKDTGIGIPREDQEMLFSKLFRASNARTLVTDGTGLGLYIVKEAIEILGGTITFVSVEGEGSTFTVSIPRTRGARSGI